MNKLPTTGQDTSDRLKWMVPFAVIVVLLIVSYFVLFHFGFGRMESAQAQVNVGQIGQDIAENVTEAASERSAEIAQAEGELEHPGSESEEIVFPEGELPPVELIELPGENGESEEVYTGPHSSYYTSSEGLGGKDITDLTTEEIRDALFSLKETQGSLAVVEGLMPVMLRFQSMISPPIDTEQFVIDDGMLLPWESGERRYSPFDSVGGDTGITAPRVKPVPPFRSLEQRGPEIDDPMCRASVIAANIKLCGVLGKPGSYWVILEGMGLRGEFRVGDVVINQCDYNFVIQDISMSGVMIVNESRPDEVGLVQFASLEGIEISISN